MPRNNRDDIDDEDDERPRRRRRPRDDDDEEEDERPRRKKKKEAGGPNKVLILALAGGGVLVFLGLVCAGLFAAGVFSPRAKAPVPGGNAPTQGGSAKDQDQAAKNRNVSQNNMTQISLGMHNQHDAQGAFQGPFAPGAADGGHSFRVGLLPYVEQADLFKRIDQKQPWDSDRNALVTNTVVSVYRDPMNPAPLGTATPYRMFVGPGALFDGTAKMPDIRTISDGTSNTILYVQATETVPWAKPQELPFGPGVPLPQLGGPGSDGFLAAMADGSVRYVKRTIPDATLRALITKAGGEAIVPQ